MASPTPARWIAPAALLAALLAVAIVYSSSTGDGEGSSSSTPPASQTSTERTRTGTTARTSQTPAAPRTTATTPTGPESYTVQAGDTLGSIAAEHDTTVQELQELNPGVDSQSLSVGQDIKLR